MDWHFKTDPLSLYLDYLEYKAACDRNGVYPPYDFYMWRRLRTQC